LKQAQETGQEADGKDQKDYYLNEQMRAIQKEMGTKDDFKAELEQLEKKIKKKRLQRRQRQRSGRSTTNSR
jgi:ATP-dependent Lon protease